MRYVPAVLLALALWSTPAWGADLSMKLAPHQRIVAGKFLMVDAIGHPTGAPDTEDVWITVGRVDGDSPCPDPPSQVGGGIELTGSRRQDGSYVARSGVPGQFTDAPGRYALCGWLVESAKGSPRVTASARLPYVVRAPRRILRVTSPSRIHDRQLVAIHLLMVTDFDAQLTIVVLRAGGCPRTPEDIVPDARELKTVVYDEQIAAGRHRLTRYAQFGRVPARGRVCVWAVQRDADGFGPGTVARASRPFRRAGGARARAAAAELVLHAGRSVAGGETNVHYVYTGPHAGDPEWSGLAISGVVLERCPATPPDFTSPQWTASQRPGREVGRIMVGAALPGRMQICVWAWKQSLDGNERTATIRLAVPITVRRPIARLRIDAPPLIRPGHVFPYRVHVVTNLPGHLTVIALRAGVCPRHLAKLVFDDRILRRLYEITLPRRRVLHLYGIFRHMPARGRICAWFDQNPTEALPRPPYREVMAQSIFRR